MQPVMSEAESSSSDKNYCPPDDKSIDPDPGLRRHIPKKTALNVADKSSPWDAFMHPERTYQEMLLRDRATGALAGTAQSQSQSRLMALPTEIRVMIWRACMEEDSTMRLRCRGVDGQDDGHDEEAINDGSGMEGEDDLFEEADERLKRGACKAFSLFGACRSIALEFAPIFVSNTTFYLFQCGSDYHPPNPSLNSWMTLKSLSPSLLGLHRLYFLLEYGYWSWLSEGNWDVFASLPRLSHFTVDLLRAWQDCQSREDFEDQGMACDEELLAGAAKLSYVPNFRVILHWPFFGSDEAAEALAALPCVIVREPDGDFMHDYTKGMNEKQEAELTPWRWD